ncbi:MAG: DMT family transporter [Propionibacteriaceae bacterium]|nr:DMT family transporter [Propionibacteriaceae bacterium]
MRYALLVVAAGVLFGTTGTTQAFAPAAASPVSIGCARMAFGGLLVALLSAAWWAKDRRGRPSGVSHPRGRWATAATVAAATAGVMAYQWTFFFGTRINGVAVGTVLALGSSPLFAGVFEWIALRRRPGLVWVGATALAVVGVGLLSLTGNAAKPPDAFGIAMSLAAGASYALYAVATKVLLEQGWHSQDAVGVTLGAASLVAFACLPFTGPGWLAEPRGLAVTAWLAVGTVVLAYSLVGAGISGLSAATAATLTLAEPATASTLGLLVLGERLTTPGVVGVAAIVCGVLVLSLAPGSLKRRANSRAACAPPRSSQSAQSKAANNSGNLRQLL